MSTSLASAKKRRANLSEPTPNPAQRQQQQQQQQQQQPAAGVGLTLPQVIKLVDTRLITLEKFMEEHSKTANTLDTAANSFTEWMDEFNKRTEIIAIEIDELKTAMLQLQTYTMEVNKKLLDKVEQLSSTAPTPQPQVIYMTAPPAIINRVSPPAPVQEEAAPAQEEPAPVQEETETVSENPITVSDSSNDTPIDM